MRSIILSIWREKCLAGGTHSQVCKLDPARIVQPVSADGGKSWEVNWISELSR